MINLKINPISILVMIRKTGERGHEIESYKHRRKPYPIQYTDIFIDQISLVTLLAIYTYRDIERLSGSHKMASHLLWVQLTCFLLPLTVVLCFPSIIAACCFLFFNLKCWIHGLIICPANCGIIPTQWNFEF